MYKQYKMLSLVFHASYEGSYHCRKNLHNPLSAKSPPSYSAGITKESILQNITSWHNLWCIYLPKGIIFSSFFNFFYFYYFISSFFPAKWLLYNWIILSLSLFFFFVIEWLSYGVTEIMLYRSWLKTR